MGMLTDFTKAKFFGASNDDAMKYALIKSVFSSDSSNKNNNGQRNNNNSYSYNDNNNSTIQREVKISKLSLTDDEKKDLQQPIIFDDSKLPFYFTNINNIKNEAKRMFEKGIGIYNKYYCIVKINKTQKEYLEFFFNKLLSCNTNIEIKETIKLYITNTGLHYLTYFINFSTDEKISIIKKTIKQNLSLRININFQEEKVIIPMQIDKNKRNILKTNPENKKDTISKDTISIEDVEITFPFFIAEMEYLSSGWIWHKADKEQAEIWKDRYPEKMDKYISDLKSYEKKVFDHCKIIKLNFDNLYNSLKEKIENLSVNQKSVLNDYLERIENCKELDALLKLQHEVYYGDGFLWLVKIIPYNDTSEPELSVRKWAFEKYKSILENKSKDNFFSTPRL